MALYNQAELYTERFQGVLLKYLSLETQVCHERVINRKPQQNNSIKLFRGFKENVKLYFLV